MIIMASKKTKAVVGAAAVAAIVIAAKEMHKKGYDKKASKYLKDSVAKLKKEAAKL